MDKYEFNIKLDQIKKLASRKDYRAAAQIANSMDWRKVKDWATLATVINVQEAAGYYEEARDTAILAYNRNQGGRRLVYKLTELFIRLRQFDDAEDLYNEYVHMAPHDVNRFILEYKLQKAENAQVGTLIEILEEYKEQEIDEKYMYELAQLYSYAEMADKCVQICDEIILWFSDGEYVDSAIRLKQKYADITATQQKIFEEAVRKKDMTDDDQTKEIIFAKAHEKARYNDELEAELAGEEQNPDITDEVQVQQPEETADFEAQESAMSSENDLYENEAGPSMDLIQNQADENAKSFFRALISRTFDNKTENEPKLKETTLPDIGTDVQNIDMALEQESQDADDIQEFVMDGRQDRQDGIEKAKQSLNELIAKARKNIEDNYENVRMQDREEKLAKTAESIEVPVGDYMYDTRNLQAELARNLGEIIGDDAQAAFDEDTTSYKPQTANLTEISHQQNAESEIHGAGSAEEEEQIEGQMSIAEWVEAVQEEKYGNRITREFSKAELERELAARESKEEAYDRLMEKQKEEAILSGQPFDEQKARRNAQQQIVMQSVKTDLAIRTGKAAARMESDVIKQKEDGKIWLFAYKNRAVEEIAAANIEKAVRASDSNDAQDMDAQQRARLAKEVMDAMNLAATAAETDSTGHTPEPLSDEPDEWQEEYDESEELEESRNYSDEYYEDEEAQDSDDYADDEAEEYSDEDAEDEDNEDYDGEEFDSDMLDDDDDTPRNVRSLFRFGRKKDRYADDEYEDEEPEASEDTEDEYDDGYEDEEEEIMEIPREIRKFFSKYNDMDGVTEQLAEYFAQADNEVGQKTSASGNIIISGNRSADKTNLAKNIARALNQMYPQYSRKIAKTTGESINQRGIIKSLSKLKGTVLIVEDAGSIVPKRITELLSVMNQDTDGMLVILIDSDTEINVLLSVNPDITDSFNHRIIIKQYAVAELVDYARKYAGKRQHVVNDDALTLLYMKINQLNKENEYVRTDEVKEIIDKAIAKAERRASRKLFGRRARRGGEYYVLTEADFKD